MQDALSPPGPGRSISLLELAERIEKLESRGPVVINVPLEELYESHYFLKAQVQGLRQILEISLSGSDPEKFQALLAEKEQSYEYCKSKGSSAPEGSLAKLEGAGMYRGHELVIALIRGVCR